MSRTRIWSLLSVVAVGPLIATTAALAKPKESHMIVEYIRYEVPPAQHEQFIAAYRAAAKDLGASEHCLRYEITEGIEEPDNFTVRIEWDSLEGHEQGFRTSAQFGSFFANVKPFFNQIREMKHYQVLQHGVGAVTK